MRLLALAVAGILAVAAVAVAATPKSGSWSGKTKQGKSITFKVQSGKVKKLKVGWKANCGGAQTNSETTFGGTYPVNGGKFTATARNIGTVKGTFTSGNKAKGTLRMQARIFTGTGFETCDTGKIRWSASR